MLKTERWLTDNYLGTTNKISVAGKTTPSVSICFVWVSSPEPMLKKNKGSSIIAWCNPSTETAETGEFLVFAG